MSEKSNGRWWQGMLLAGGTVFVGLVLARDWSATAEAAKGGSSEGAGRQQSAASRSGTETGAIRRS